jgi:hypothetical protein
MTELGDLIVCFQEGRWNAENNELGQAAENPACHPAAAGRSGRVRLHGSGVRDCACVRSINRCFGSESEGLARIRNRKKFEFMDLNPKKN